MDGWTVYAHGAGSRFTAFVDETLGDDRYVEKQRPTRTKEISEVGSVI